MKQTEDILVTSVYIIYVLYIGLLITELRLVIANRDVLYAFPIEIKTSGFKLSEIVYGTPG